jgi:hypothetical protein
MSDLGWVFLFIIRPLGNGLYQHPQMQPILDPKTSSISVSVAVSFPNPIREPGGRVGYQVRSL